MTGTAPTKCDCHVHTLFSPDGHQSMQDACQRAAALGLDAVCFTEHLDFGPGEQEYYNPEAYFAELERMRERYAEQMQILAGLEISEPHRHLHELEEAQKRPYDFILGSVHAWIGDLFASEIARLDMPAEQIYDAYWAEVLQMVQCGGFDAVAHLDFPKRYMKDVSLFEPARLSAIFAEMHKRGLLLEINTSSLRKGCLETMPGAALLRQYKAAGGAYVTLGSDAHRTQDLYAALPETKRKAEALGLRPVYFVQRKMRLA